MSATMTAAPIGPSGNILQPWTDQQILQNNAARAQLLAQAKRRYTQNIYTTNITPLFGQQSIVNVNLVPLGLIAKYWVEISTVVTNPAGGSTLTRGSNGAFASLSQITYTDPGQNVRINTTGYHLAAVTARRRRRVPGQALTSDTPSGYGSVIQSIAAPATIAANASGTVRCMYEVPLAVGQDTTKGAVFGGAVFANQSLQLIFNPNFCQAAADPLGAVYTGAATTAGNMPTYATSIVVYQEYWDGFDLGLLRFLSPDLSTSYNLNLTSINNLLAANDNFVRFDNLRTFLSTMLAFDNGGTLNAGSDVTYFKLQAANQTPLFTRDIYLQSYITRNHLGDDMPAGFYMFDFSEAPIITAAEGNTVLSMNPSTVNANAVLYIGWEFLAINQVLAGASQLFGSAGLGH